jgi:hypothetical protein
MDNAKQILITVPGSPYSVLGVDFDAKGRDIQAAFRAFFRQNPRQGNRIGKSASKKLTDPRERIKIDTFCCPVDIPQVDLNDLKERLESNHQGIYCQAVDDPVILSDLYFSDCLPENLSVDYAFEELEYRSDYAAVHKNQ